MAITAGLSGAGRLAAFRVGKNPLANCAKNQYNRIVSLNISMNEVLLMPLWKRTLAALLLAVMMILPFASAEDAGEAVPDDSVEWTEGAVNITRDLTLNDEGDDVSALQTALTDLCYYSGDVTGRYGEATKTAVEDFQRDFALAVTGVADKATQEAIYAAEYRPLRLGCVGEDVRQAQIRLMALGYYTGKISGRYLPATQEAIRLFQTANALPITGEADVQTLERLFSGDAISRDSSAAATPTPSPTPGMHLSDETTTPTPAPTVAFVKKLQYNKSKGEEVKLVQTRLTELGYYSGNISGNFLGHTRNAVKAFQQQNALSVDGIVGENTWNALFNDPDVRAATDDPKPTPEPTPVPFAITVDVNNQVTTVYGRDENGDYTVVVRQMLCSTGTRKNPSDIGTFTLNGRTARWCYFPEWGSHAQYWTRINSSIAFHSVIYNTVNTMDLSVKSYKNLGKRASHGCIRLTVADAKWIYNNCGAGTVVTIRADMPAAADRRAGLPRRGDAAAALPDAESEQLRRGCVLDAAEADGFGVLFGQVLWHVPGRYAERGEGVPEGEQFVCDGDGGCQDAESAVCGGTVGDAHAGGRGG
jgi:peptidoglycan hydrolase-like protein with peptidoglycan-binding domain